MVPPVRQIRTVFPYLAVGMEISNLSQSTFQVIKIFPETFAGVRGHLIKCFVSEHRRNIIKDCAHEQHRRKDVSLGVRRVDLSAHAN